MIKGIDLSHHQRKTAIDWPKVRAAGVLFAICRASYGTKPDDTFAYHAAKAQSVGIVGGAYHFLRFNDQSAEEQAEVFLARVRASVVGADATAPIALDLEGNTEHGDAEVGPASRAAYVERAHRWLSIVEAALGRTAIIYTGPSFWEHQVGNYNGFAKRPLWIAHYTNNPVPRVPSAWADWAIWQQYGSVPGFIGTIDGIDGAVDVNWCKAPACLGLVDAPGADPQPAITTRDLQARLNALGALPPLAVDGDLGPLTWGALFAELRKHGRPDAGVLSDAALRTLGL